MALPALMAAGSALQVGAGIAGAIRGEKGKAKDYARAQAILDSLEAPTEQDLRIKLEYLKDMGQLTPEMEADILQVATEMGTIQVDPRLKQAQMEALGRLQRQADQGLTLEELAAAEELKRQQQQATRAENEAIMQNMAARGQLGGGQELAAKLAGSQAAAEAAAQDTRSLAKLMAARKLEAGVQAGQFAGQVGEQEYGRQAEKARAQDIINQFNVQGRRGVEQRNVGGRNEAQQYNLDYKKALEQNRVATMNQQAEEDRWAKQQAIAARNANRMRQYGHLTGGYGEGMQSDAKFQGRLKAVQGIGGAMQGAGQTDWGSIFGGGGQRTAQVNELDGFDMNQAAAAQSKRRRVTG